MLSFLQILWQILLELSPSLLLGLLIAGLMHAYMPDGFVHRGLSGNDWRSVTRASLIGVPLPLCSCGVIPTALGLRKEGASPGATTSFLISTPQTGVDAILVSAAFLGWPFAIFKLIAAFVTGIAGGVLTNRLVPRRDGLGPESEADSQCGAQDGKTRGLWGAVRYAVFDLLGAIDRWLIFGILAAALVTALTPEDFFASQAWSSGLLGMLVVLAISLPLYVCTTASVPIAASLIAAGLPAGSALVFLMAGPATNVATIGAVYRTLGPRVITIYLATVILSSLGFGLMFDQLLSVDLGAGHAHGEHGGWLNYLSAILLLALLGFLEFRRQRQRQMEREAAARVESGNQGGMVLQVGGMTCGHCVASVKNALEAVDQVEEAIPELSSGRVRLRAAEGVRADALREAVEQAGFQLKALNQET
ncbi:MULTISPECIES: permease [Thiorhodovibrio]|uniref:permease n=1 Tax=Thiorhodovibrio TaxID=61593 RepID=UPI001913C03C|nr:MULTISPECIES: permease [Thiorhodovibrio]MBK5967558.1 hypothetical protein [Thiorhodovibrio winogradskyi]WPL14048.1 Copper chaperone CopZ [Thiorhodovibrio litoralis]